MHYFKPYTIAFGLLILLNACGKGDNNFDASGSFEAEEVIISAEATGLIKDLNLEEGQQLAVGADIGYIDSTQLYLRKKQLESQVKAVLSRTPDIPKQLAALQSQLKNAEKEQLRISNLVKGDAAPAKQLDDINAQVDVLKKQITAQQSALGISSSSIHKEASPIEIQIEQLDDQLSKCRIINPIQGTVLSKYAYANEMTAAGKPLYKIADLSSIILRAYISGDQLKSVGLRQKVEVLTDDGKGGFDKATGTVIWISDKAEFTPKTIQTKDERANMVYAIKVKVKNDGAYKIGMYGEIKFLATTKE